MRRRRGMARYGGLYHAEHGELSGTARASRHLAASLAEHRHYHVAHSCLCVGRGPHDAKGLYGYHSAALCVAGDSFSSLAQGSSFVEKQMAVYAEVATSPRVLDQVVAQLGLNTTAAQLANSIEVSVPVDSVIIEVAVTDPDPRQAARIANAVGTELAKAAGELTPSREDGSEAVRGTTIAVAQVPTSPSSLLDRLRRLAH